MSKSINVIGFSAEKIDENGESYYYECHATNKLEMLQQARIMERQYSAPVVGWYAITRTGCKMLGNDVHTLETIPADKVKYKKTNGRKTFNNQVAGRFVSIDKEGNIIDSSKDGIEWTNHRKI
jgi:hypothetical protein